jgi:hypothetical protein
MTSPFIYLLNAFEQAGQAKNPSVLDYARKRKAVLEYVAKLEASAPSSMGARTPDEEASLLHDVLNLARETLFIGVKGSPEELQRSLGRLNLACKAHWDWHTATLLTGGGPDGKV